MIKKSSSRVCYVNQRHKMCAIVSFDRVVDNLFDLSDSSNDHYCSSIKSGDEEC